MKSVADTKWDPSRREKAPVSILFYVRLLIAISGQMAFLTGFWNIIDEQTITPTWLVMH